MPLHRLATAACLTAITAASITSSNAAPVPVNSLASQDVRFVIVGDKARAAATGAIVGGALGVMLGATLGQNARQPAPAYVRPPQYDTIEEVDPEPPVIIERQRSRRVVEVEEEAPQLIEEEECITRRTRIYDPATGRTVFRKERNCN